VIARNLQVSFSCKEKQMAQAYMPQDRIVELGRRWAKAELDSDTETLGRLLDPDFVCVGPVGFVINKEQYLAGRRSGDLKQQAFVWDGASVRVYGDAAIAVGTQVQTSTFQGRDSSGRFRMTQVLVRKGDGWVIASLHLSPITPAPGWILGALQAGPAAPPALDRQGGAR
jgi:ketosteroid isomerase-like protein